MSRFVSGTKKDFAPDDVVVAQLLSPVTAASCADHLNNLCQFREPTRLYGVPLEARPCSEASPALFLIVDTHARNKTRAA